MVLQKYLWDLPCDSNLCIQDTLEIKHLCQHLYLFNSYIWAHLRHFLGDQMGHNLVQTYIYILWVRIVCILPSNMPVQLAIFYRQSSCSATAFKEVTKILALQERVSHFTNNFSALKKASKGAKIRNRYNQVQHLTQDTNGNVTNSQLDTTNESQEISPFPAGDHKAHINRRAQIHNKHKTEKNP